MPKGEIDIQVAQLKELRSMNGKITFFVMLTVVNLILGLMAVVAAASSS